MGGRDGWGLSPLGWGLAYATVAVEVGTITGWWPPLGHLGPVWLPPSAIPGFLLLGALGRQLVVGGRRWIPFLIWAAAVAAVPAVGFRHLFGGVEGLTGFALAALQEEAVYRAAMPLVVWRFLRGFGGDPAWCRAGALAVPALLFSLLPNHLRQADTALGVLPFFTFALFLGLLVRRPNVVLPAALVHLAVNLMTIPVTIGPVDPLARRLGVSALLAAFALVALGLTDKDEAGSPAPVPETL